MLLEQNDVASIKLVLLDITAPPFCQHIALAAVPIGVTEPPAFSGLVLEVQQQALSVGGVAVGADRKMCLRVGLRDDEAVQLPDVAGSQHLLEHELPHVLSYYLLLLSVLVVVMQGWLCLVSAVETECGGRRRVMRIEPCGGLLVVLIGVPTSNGDG